MKNDGLAQRLAYMGGTIAALRQTVGEGKELTEDQAKQVEKLLRELCCNSLGALDQAARLGTELMKAIAAQTPVFAVEVGVMRRDNGVDYIWLAERPAGDDYVGLHSPGSLVWAEDGEGVEYTVRRLAERKYGNAGALRLLTPDPIRVSWGPTIRWPVEGSLVYLAELVGDDPPPDKGRWVPVLDALEMGDDEIIPEHRDGLIQSMHEAWLELTQLGDEINMSDLTTMVGVAAGGDDISMYSVAQRLEARANLLKLIMPGGPLGRELWDEAERTAGNVDDGFDR